MFRKLLLSLALASLTAAAAASPPSTVIAVGVDSAGVTYTLWQTHDGTQCAGTYGRAYSDSLGRSGCWTADSTRSRYVLAQQRPVAAMRFLSYSQAVVCPEGAATAEQCISPE